MTAETTPASPAEPQISGVRFVLQAGAWMVGLFALLRLGPIQRFVLLPLAAVQQTIGAELSGAPIGAVGLDASCSAADVTALCLGVIFASPLPWRERLRGALLGLLLIAGMNTVRLGHLSLVADDPWRLNLLHIYVWPALLTVGVLAYAFFWLRRASDRARADDRELTSWRPGARFLLIAGVLTAVYFAVAPWAFVSPTITTASAGVAATAAALMTVLGATASASGIALQTANGVFLVTPECIVTPLIPVYGAAALAAPLPLGRRVLVLAGAPLVFFGLGTARLLVLALPPSLIASPALLVHGFSQVVAGIVLVALATVRARRPEGDSRHRLQESRAARSTGRAFGIALLAGTSVTLAAAAVWDGLLFTAVAAARAGIGHAGHEFHDAQGAMALLPAYQLGLLVALWAAMAAPSTWRRLVAGLFALAASQAVLIAALGELFAHVGFDPHVGLVRAWAVAAPVLVALVIERPEVSWPRLFEAPAPEAEGVR